MFSSRSSILFSSSRSSSRPIPFSLRYGKGQRTIQKSIRTMSCSFPFESFRVKIVKKPVYQMVLLRACAYFYYSLQKMAASPLRPRFDMRLVNLDKISSGLSGNCKTCRKEPDLQNFPFMIRTTEVYHLKYGITSGMV